MTEYLHAWINDEHVGVFEKKSPLHRATFRYNEDANYDLSLSMTRDRQLTRKSAQNFLDGLVPEDEGTRANMRDLTRARSAESWDLMYALNGDLPGGVLLCSAEGPPDRGEPFTALAQESEIAARIASIKRGGSGLGDFDAPPRFSLAGAQGKFALVIDRGSYFWPDAATPSTHIVKPARSEHPGLDEIESASLELARRMGITAAAAEVARFDAETSFITSRFDRFADGEETVHRLHMEDVAQALGFAPEQKYRVGTARTIRLLREHGANSDVQYDLIEQLAFTIAIGNADAHAKNYTVMHGFDRGVTLSPLYDTVPIALMPQFEQELGMRIGNERRARGVALDDWRRLAKKAALDPDRVTAIVVRVNARFLEHVTDVLEDTEIVRTRQREFDELLRNADRIIRLANSQR